MQMLSAEEDLAEPSRNIEKAKIGIRKRKLATGSRGPL
jgi:hypothetical protein